MLLPYKKLNKLIHTMRLGTGAVLPDSKKNYQIVALLQLTRSPFLHKKMRIMQDCRLG